MKHRDLAVAGALEFTPDPVGDHRGRIVVPFLAGEFAEATGAPLFRVAQTICSTSRRHVARGIHYTEVPPGTAKYVYCVRGSALDVVVDLRVGSPTFGRWDAVVLDPSSCRAVYLPVGVGHAFLALEDDTVVHYMLSAEYVTEREHAVALLDPALALPVGEDLAPILSDRDRSAPTLAEAEAAGLLPHYSRCR